MTKRVFSSIVRLEERGSFPHFLTSIPEGFFSGSTTGTERIRPVFDCQLINSKFRDLAVKIPSSTLAISRTFPTGLLLLRMISTNQFNDAGGVLEIPFITEDMAQKSLNKLTSTQYQKYSKILPKNSSEANDEHTDFKKVDINRRKTSESI